MSEWCGFIDETGKEVIPLKYIAADDFIGGLVFVVDQEDNGFFIDKNDNAIVSLTDVCGKFAANDAPGCAQYWYDNGFLLSEKNNKFGLVEIVKNESTDNSNKPHKRIKPMDKVNWFQSNQDDLNKRSLANKIAAMSEDEIDKLSYTEYKKMCDIFKIDSADFNALRKIVKECSDAIYDFKIGEWQPLKKISLLTSRFEKLCIVKADLSEAMVIAVVGRNPFKGFSIHSDEALVVLTKDKRAVVTWVGSEFSNTYNP